ncbi:MAG: hypothetical protein WCK70_12910 [Chloroflexales bacterium]
MRRTIIISSLVLGLALSACAAPVSTTTITGPTAPIVSTATTTGPTAPIVSTTTTTGPTTPIVSTTSQPIAPTGMGAAQGNGSQNNPDSGMAQSTRVAQNNQGAGMGQGNGGQGMGMGQGNQGNGGQSMGMGRGNGTQSTAPTTVLPTNLPETPCRMCDTDMSQYTGPLSAAEIDGLLLALNDEYHAWAVYQQVVADFGDVRPFANIISSEASHINRLEALFRTYGVPLPAANPWVGQAPRFASVNEACTVGVDAEIVNVNLYTRLVTSTSRTDILQVYNLLQAASRDNHLPSFQRCA